MGRGSYWRRGLSVGKGEIMNKKIVVFMLLVFFLFLNGNGSPDRIAKASAAVGVITAETYDIDGLWTLSLFVVDLNMTVDLDAIVVGNENKLILALGKNMETGFTGRCTVTDDDIEFTGSGGVNISAAGKAANADYMSGTWLQTDGSYYGTWTANRNTMTPSPAFDIRGMWALAFENENVPLPWPNNDVFFAWPATFSGSNVAGTCEFTDLVSGNISILFPEGPYTVSGDQVTITLNYNGGTTTLTGENVNGNMLAGTYNYDNSNGTGSGPWYGILYALSGNNPPFGAFETPVDGAAVYGSVPVTGWALAGRGVEKVEIFRLDGETRVYIGDALFVTGARPDIQVAYPKYPMNSKAGWGYMLLTNFLPNGGNGTFVLEAVATDYVGNSTSLGTTTIYCDNANAVKPFGAIDTPGPGKVASGSNYKNNGWVLTPPSDSIPTDGSTINVYVDGVYLGHPVYNLYRSDIDALFPGYANSSGAGGSFTLDITSFGNGLHTIFWTAKDSGGDEEGIGSRYFVIGNLSGSTARQASWIFGNKIDSRMDLDKRFLNLPVLMPFKKGFFGSGAAQAPAINRSDLHKITVKELGRVEILLAEQMSSIRDIRGYLSVDNRLRDLPVGSTLDVKQGKFSWLPGPGFLGRYTVVFVINGTDGQVSKKAYEINIKPRFEVRKSGDE